MMKSEEFFAVKIGINFEKDKELIDDMKVEASEEGGKYFEDENKWGFEFEDGALHVWPKPHGTGMFVSGDWVKRYNEMRKCTFTQPWST